MIEGVWCFIVCFGVSQPPQVVAPIDNYCQSYRRVVLNKHELADVMKLSRGLRTRLQGNELEYMCRCMGWKNKACRGLSSTKQ